MSPEADAPQSPGRPRAAPSPLRRVAFSLLPALLLFGVVEIALRVLGMASPALGTLPLPEEYKGLFRPDEELFWRLHPDLDVPFQGVRVHTGPRGLRMPEPPPKRPGELRVLSLGESTTFGVGVRDEETYSALLEEHLREFETLATGGDPRPVEVANAGVPAWSSFQSLQYLKHEGIELEPDLVLFYHELNDYLPSSLRDSSHNEIGLSQSDPQLHASRRSRLDRMLLDHWALYRFLVFRKAQAEIAALQRSPRGRAAADIGLPSIGIAPRTVRRNDPDAGAAVAEGALPPRVLPEERRAILAELADFCAARGIRLAILHPAYRDSSPHECVLTDFCVERGVACFEVHPVLHPRGGETDPLYLDRWHPTARGHALLARRLASWLVKEGLHRERKPVAARSASMLPTPPG